MTTAATPDTARAFFERECDPFYVGIAARLVDDDEAYWTADPQVAGVYGLVLSNEPSRALVVVYLDDLDFECDIDRLEACREER